jgi:two-component system sensor histidine kinase MprB
MTIAVAAAVAVAVTLVATVAYLAVRGELRAEVDRALDGQLRVRDDQPLPPIRAGGPRFRPLPAGRGGPTPYIQAVDASGTVLGVLGSESAELPVTGRVRDVAAGVSPRFFSDAEVDGTHVRVLTVPALGGAVQLGRSLEGADSVLRRLRLILALVCLGGIALAVALGRLASRNVVAPIVHVSEAARHIAATEDLGRRIEVETQDEVGELAEHFNAMLNTLERSVAAQRQLVADASHELRTPITSLRTNIEVLAESEALPADERARLLADVEEQTTELGMLVADLIEMARGDEPSHDTEDVRLDDLVGEAVARARRHAPGVAFEVELEPAVVEGTRERLARAVNNLLDNAARHSPRGGVVEVRADRAGLRVRDHGDGIAEQDLPQLFDRFYRGASARGRPGSGLGLAIVRQVAEQHGGSVHAANAAGGGAEFVLELPATVPAASDDGTLGAAPTTINPGASATR